MIPIPSGVRVWIATGHTDMRKGFDGLALLVQETLRRNPHNGHLFVFRGRRGSLAHYLGHRNLQSTARYTALAPGRFERIEDSCAGLKERPPWPETGANLTSSARERPSAGQDIMQPNQRAE